MYLDFFGLRELPFTLTPNTDFFMELEGHRQALAVIQSALKSGEGCIRITGEIGTGKTLLCRRLLNTLPEAFVTAYIPNPFLTPEGLMLALAEELDLQVAPEKGLQHVLGQINNRLIRLGREGRKVVFLLDEAQAMPVESLGALLLLINLGAETEAPLQLVLFGQPELNDLLNRDSLRPLKQRFTFVFTLPVLKANEVVGYIRHRLACAGINGNDLFSDGAQNKIHKASGGNPRLINILCHKAMLVAFGRSDNRIAQTHVDRAVDDTEDVTTARLHAQPSGRHWSTLLIAGLIVSGITLLTIGVFNLV